MSANGNSRPIYLLRAFPHENGCHLNSVPIPSSVKPWMLALCIFAIEPAAAAPFRNLDFEESNLSGLLIEGEANSVWSVSSEALNGWEVRYNDFKLDRVSINERRAHYPSASLNSFGIINGVFGPKVQGHYGMSFNPIIADQGNGTGTFTLSQRGEIPIEASSIQFMSYWEHFKFYVEGVEVPVTYRRTDDLAIGPWYWYQGSGDISAFAGRTVEIKFETFESGAVFPPNHGTTSANAIDSIRFSPEAVPEPSTIGLLGLGAWLMWLQRHKR